jgi:hypothetical protein
MLVYTIQMLAYKTAVSKTVNNVFLYSFKYLFTYFLIYVFIYLFYKLVINFNSYTIEINNIEDQKWIEHYKSLWCSNSPQNNNDEPDTTPTPLAEMDEIPIEELEQNLKSMKNRKAAGPEGFNSELFKYGGPVL